MAPNSVNDSVADPFGAPSTQRKRLLGEYDATKGWSLQATGALEFVDHNRGTLSIGQIKDKEGNTWQQWTYAQARPGASNFAYDLSTDMLRVLLLLEDRPNFPEPVLCAPGGFCEVGEDPMLTAQRELEEETGIAADLSRMVCLNEVEIAGNRAYDDMVNGHGTIPFGTALTSAQVRQIEDRIANEVGCALRLLTPREARTSADGLAKAGLFDLVTYLGLI